jgi:ubiquinone/menaquinone biosynthesis C-methylase UbiE
VEEESMNNEFSELVKQEWTVDDTAKAWRKWHNKLVPHLASLTKVLLEAAAILPGAKVLDIASGSGEPALTISEMLGPTGKVMATDLSTGMLKIAEDNANKANKNNLEFKQADVHELPFEDGSYDVVTCRLGVMYFWDCQRALREIGRVLKPGGVASFVAWGDVSKNGLVRSIIGPFANRKELPTPPPSAPHPFRFAKEGSLSTELKSAGFSQVNEQTHIVPCPWPGPPEELLNQVYEIAIPLQPFFNSFDNQDKQQAEQEVIAILNTFYDGINTDPSICIVAAKAVYKTDAIPGFGIVSV